MKNQKIMTDEEWLSLFPELINDYILPHVPLEIRALKKIKWEIEFILHKRVEILNKKFEFEEKQLLQVATLFCQEYDESDLFRVSEQIAYLEEMLKLAKIPIKKHGHGNKL